MGDTLEENFVLDDVEEEQVPEITKVSKKQNSKAAVAPAAAAPVQKSKKRNWREAVTSGFSSSTSQCLLLKEAMNFKASTEYSSIEFEDMGISETSFIALSEDCTKDFSSIATVTSAVQDIFSAAKTVTSPSIVILTPSTNRCSEISVHIAGMKPLSLQLHGSGRKQEQFSRMKKDMVTSSVVISVPSRLSRVCEESSFDFNNLKLVILDMFVDPKGLNILSMNETRDATVQLFTKHLVNRLKTGDCKVLLY